MYEFDTQLEERIRGTAAECLGLLDELFPPRSVEEQGQVQDLLASGVSKRRLHSLYPLSGDDYVEAINTCHLIPVELNRLMEQLGSSNFYTVQRLLKFEYRVASEIPLAQLASWCLWLAEVPLSEMLGSDDPYVRNMNAGDAELLLDQSLEKLDAASILRRGRERNRRGPSRHGGQVLRQAPAHFNPIAQP